MKVAIIGLGVVGTGVYEQLIENADKIEYEIGEKIELSYGLVRKLKPDTKDKYPNLKITTDIMDIINDEEVGCIIEVMGNMDVAYEYLKLAFEHGKNVVSANKDLIAKHGVELLRLAKDNNCDFYFEASVAGGIPIIRSLTKNLASDHIYDIKGILNGTSNYILTKMSQDNLTYEVALKNAQELGFAESDPTNDVVGFDAANKIAILAMLCFHINASIDNVDYKGITNVSENDFKVAHSLDYEIKLIAHTHYENKELLINVKPTFVKKDHLLANVDNEMNAIYAKGERIGDIMLYGAGAGANPTATAVLADVLEVARNTQGSCNGRDIVLPTDEKFDEVRNNVQEYIITKNIEVDTKIIEQTNDYIIAEMNQEKADKIAAEYNCNVYEIMK